MMCPRGISTPTMEDGNSDHSTRNDGRAAVFNVPNFLSAYRIAVVPAILFAILNGHRMAFAWLILVSLVTDILDGMLARRWHQETRLGTWLDSVADLLTYFLALLGMIVLEGPFIRAHGIEIGLLVGFYLASEIVSIARFHRPIAMHLYSSKLTGVAQGVFFAVYFLYAYVPAVFYAMIALGILNNVEEIIVLCLLDEVRLNARGLYWVLKERRVHR